MHYVGGCDRQSVSWTQNTPIHVRFSRQHWSKTTELTPSHHRSGLVTEPGWFVELFYVISLRGVKWHHPLERCWPLSIHFSLLLTFSILIYILDFPFTSVTITINLHHHPRWLTYFTPTPALLSLALGRLCISLKSQVVMSPSKSPLPL